MPTPHFPPRSSVASTAVEFDRPQYVAITLPLFQETASEAESSITREKYLLTPPDAYQVIAGGPVGRVTLDGAELAAIPGAAAFISALRTAIIDKWTPIAPP